MAQSHIVQLPQKLRASDYECSRECISPEASTAPCGQDPLQRNWSQNHVNHCSDSACCELPQSEPHQNIAELERAKTSGSSQLYVKCPSLCSREIDVAEIKLACEGRNRKIWNCGLCRKIKKKQVKIAWCRFVCVQCTHAHGTTCLIERCTSNCPTRKALERLKVVSDVDRTFKKAKSMIEGLKEPELVERLTICLDSWKWSRTS